MMVPEVVVIGAGTMGAGIAQLAATRGCRVRLIDVSGEVLERGVGGIRSRLDRSVEKGKRSGEERDAILDRLVASTGYDDLRGIPLAIEAVVESMDIKARVFKSLEGAMDSTAVLATNTSSLSVTQIAAATQRPGRIVGMHFFNPAPVMPLVEVIAGESSDSSAIDLAFDAAKAWGKVPVRAKDTPGFIVNRVARGFYLEALRMLGEGVAGVETIDGAMRTLGGFRMGPFELMDLIGIDVNYAVSCSVYEQSGRPARLQPHPIQKELVQKGETGRKAGRGLYRYDTDPPTAAVQIGEASFDLPDSVQRFASAGSRCDIETFDRSDPVHRYVFARIVATIMNEAAMALEDGVATAADIDTAMQKGTNYPKGPLAWADEIGNEPVATLLAALDGQSGDGRFAAARRFRD